ncbi:SCO family protein [Pseudomonas sp. CFBP 8770]|uniref:SCO family protein n=1 Tax=unclassified Pseudomonas TaxID=196821 RepID=UPI00177B4EDB|nr:MULTISPECIES: SCO family protein [unclassified Pseudomonas]MBD8476537.1 SCO family protein [Pseudomonas sp. CFBP 8773]MBD8649429.1 SCO family protein [Pseudomonas sp. CFBP 8770]
MSVLMTRRKVVAGIGLLSLSILTGCDTREELTYKHGKNLSNQILGRSFKLKDTNGDVRMLSSYRGMIPLVFFGFTQCPAICPTALARAVQIKKLMGKDGDRLQVIFITLDPERDTPAVLNAYVKTFDPSFVALYGTLEETAATAKEFGVFYEKIPSGSTYTLSHSATSYVYDIRGTLRLGLPHSLSAQECAEDLLTVMKVS